MLLTLQQLISEACCQHCENHSALEWRCSSPPSHRLVIIGCKNETWKCNWSLVESLLCCRRSHKYLSRWTLTWVIGGGTLQPYNGIGSGAGSLLTEKNPLSFVMPPFHICTSEEIQKLISSVQLHQIMVSCKYHSSSSPTVIRITLFMWKLSTRSPIALHAVPGLLLLCSSMRLTWSLYSGTDRIKCASEN